MSLMHLSTTEVIRHSVNQPVMTDLELALLDKLYSALDEVDTLMATLDKLHLEQGDTEAEAVCGHT